MFAFYVTKFALIKLILFVFINYPKSGLKKKKNDDVVSKNKGSFFHDLDRYPSFNGGEKKGDTESEVFPNMSPYCKVLYFAFVLSFFLPFLRSSLFLDFYVFKEKSNVKNPCSLYKYRVVQSYRKKKCY